MSLKVYYRSTIIIKHHIWLPRYADPGLNYWLVTILKLWKIRYQNLHKQFHYRCWLRFQRRNSKELYLLARSLVNAALLCHAFDFCFQYSRYRPCPKDYFTRKCNAKWSTLPIQEWSWIWSYQEMVGPVFWRSIKSFANAKNHLSLLSYGQWEDIEGEETRKDLFAYNKDLYIENPRNISDEIMITTPARAPQNYFSDGYMNLLWILTCVESFYISA